MFEFIGKLAVGLTIFVIIAWLVITGLTCSVQVGVVGRANASCPFPWAWMAE